MAVAALWSPDGRTRRLRRRNDNVQSISCRANGGHRTARVGGSSRERSRCAQRFGRAARECECECECQRQGLIVGPFGRTVSQDIGSAIGGAKCGTGGHRYPAA